MSEETSIIINTIAQQRNAALDTVAQLQAQLQMALKRISELENNKQKKE